MKGFIIEDYCAKSKTVTILGSELLRPDIKTNETEEILIQSINWGLHPKDKGRSGPKGLYYLEKNVVIL